MKSFKGLILASLFTIMLMMALYYSLLHLKEASYEQPNKQVSLQMKSVQLSNDNIVDVLNANVDTTRLTKVNLNQHILEVELLIDTGQSPQNYIYEEFPQYIALAFKYTTNVEQLKLKVMEQQLNSNNKVYILTSHIYRNDAWLERGIEQLNAINWLEDDGWRQRLRLNKTIYWQKQYEI